MLDDHGVLSIDLAATSDWPTTVNLTNHALVDMAEAGSPSSVPGRRLTIPAARYTPVDATLIPMEELPPVASTVRYADRAGADAIRRPAATREIRRSCWPRPRP